MLRAYHCLKFEVKGSLGRDGRKKAKVQKCENDTMLNTNPPKPSS